MRKIQLLLAAAILFSVSSFGQLEKNNFYGGLSWSTGIKGPGSTAYEFRPSASIALGKHSLVSLYGRYQESKEYKNPYYVDQTERVSQYGIGFGYTYYRSFKKEGKFGWYIDATYLINRISSYDMKSGVTQLNFRQTEKQMYLTPGLFYKPTPRVLFFLNFGGVRLFGDYQYNDIGNVINVGVRISLGKRAKKIKQKPSN